METTGRHSYRSNPEVTNPNPEVTNMQPQDVEQARLKLRSIQAENAKMDRFTAFQNLDAYYVEYINHWQKGYKQLRFWNRINQFLHGNSKSPFAESCVMLSWMVFFGLAIFDVSGWPLFLMILAAGISGIELSWAVSFYKKRSAWAHKYSKQFRSLTGEEITEQEAMLRHSPKKEV